jgi:hypothetical protein
VNALALAAEMLGEVEPTPGQLAQLRALDRKYAQRMYGLMHDSADGSGRRELTGAEAARLRAQLEAEILALLAPGVSHPSEAKDLEG